MVNICDVIRSGVVVPGNCLSVARQFLRCVLHQLAPNNVFPQIFMSRLGGSYFVILFLPLSHVRIRVSLDSPKICLIILPETFHFASFLLSIVSIFIMRQLFIPSSDVSNSYAFRLLILIVKGNSGVLMYRLVCTACWVIWRPQ